MYHNKSAFFNQEFIAENQQVELPILKEKQVELFIKREDEIHSEVSGNKFRKLKYNIFEAKNQQKRQLLTFGGAFSNHILATAVAGKMTNFTTIGVIRGEELGVNVEKTLSENTTLQKAHNNGMTFEFVTRKQFREKTSQNFIKQLKEKFGDFYVIPEGGTNALAMKGCEEILTQTDEEFNYICCAVGTGGTIAGLINASKKHQKIVGFPALKGNFLHDEIQKFTTKENWSLQTAYHFGGYAKYNETLIRFINEFKTRTKIPLDPIYTGKMMFGIINLIQQDFFKKGSKILAIHTGGLQGISGINQKLKQQKQTILI